MPEKIDPMPSGEFITLSPEEAKRLVEEANANQWDELHVDATHLDVETAKELAKSHGPFLYFDKLTQIDVSVAETLATIKSELMVFENLISITPPSRQGVGKVQRK